MNILFNYTYNLLITITIFTTFYYFIKNIKGEKMKAILSYSSYFSYGKQYQLKFIYERKHEIETINKIIQQLKNIKSIKPYHLDESNKVSFNKTNKIGGINIPKDILIPLLSLFITSNNINIVIGNKEFTTFNVEKIQEAINKLHITGFLTKGNYFNFGQMYYITFKYANDEQRNELLYDFYSKFNLTLGRNSERDAKGKEYIMPFLVDNTGYITIENNASIGGTNIPIDLLPDFIKKFIEDYNMIIYIGDEQFKDIFDKERFETALTSIEPGIARKLKNPNT